MMMPAAVVFAAATTAAAAAAALSPWRGDIAAVEGAGLAHGLACTPPTPMSIAAPNVMLIGDSISEGENGYSLFVQDMLTNSSGGTLVGSLQHGGGFGGGGQMASSNNGVAKVTACIGNATGTLKRKAWSVITYNAGLHDCDAGERVEPAAYTANLKAIFETLKPAASAVVFVTTTPWPQNGPLNKTINCNNRTDLCMSCVREYNVIAKQVAKEVGAVVVDDLYEYVEDFCRVFPKDSDGDYSTCAVQSPKDNHTSLHFFNHAPNPSGQQYTGLLVAEAVIRLIPEAEIQNATTGDAPSLTSGYDVGRPLVCGNAPAPLNKTLPNVLIIGDSIAEPGSGYGPGVEHILKQPRPGLSGYQTGPLASVQHNGATGSNQAGPTTNGAACVKTWVGAEKWDVVTMNFGIHDCCPGGDGRPAGADVPLADYIKNLGIIYETASQALAPGGKIVWVTTTPVPTGMSVSSTCGISGAAFNTCVDDYSDAALKLLGLKPDVIVADLHNAVLDVCGAGYKTCNLQRWGDVHFTDAGKQFCAVVVAKNVAPLLAPKWVVLQSNATSA